MRDHRRQGARRCRAGASKATSTSGGWSSRKGLRRVHRLRPAQEQSGVPPDRHHQATRRAVSDRVDRRSLARLHRYRATRRRQDRGCDLERAARGPRAGRGMLHGVVGRHVQRAGIAAPAQSGEARNAIAAVFGSSADVKHVFVVDEDIDVFSDEQIDWALATRFQADRDIVIASGFRRVPLDPSLQGSRTGPCRVRLHQAVRQGRQRRVYGAAAAPAAAPDRLHRNPERPRGASKQCWRKAPRPISS